MTTHLARDEALSNIAALAYRRARVLVYDQLAPGAPIVESRLSAAQNEAITELLMAEASLDDYRRDHRLDCGGVRD